MREYRLISILVMVLGVCLVKLSIAMVHSVAVLGFGAFLTLAGLAGFLLCIIIEKEW